MTGAMTIEIERLSKREDAEWCAKVMAGSEPWITLGRSYEDSLVIVTDPVKETYVARSEGNLCGFLILNLAGTLSGYIQTVCVGPDMRGKGLGTRLLRFAEEQIFKTSPNVFLCVSSFNAEAKKLYERLGYQTIGELKDYLARGHSEILMRKTSGPLNEFVRGAGR